MRPVQLSCWALAVWPVQMAVAKMMAAMVANAERMAWLLGVGMLSLLVCK